MSDFIDPADDEQSTAVADPEEVEEKPVPDAEDDSSEEDVEDDDPEGEDSDDEEEEAEEEIEFNFGGNKKSFAKNASLEDVAEDFQNYVKTIEANHTQRSQAVAETTKSLEAREAAIQKLEGMNGELLNTFSTGLAIKNELDQLEKVDLNEMWQSDPDQARRISDVISQKKNQLNGIRQAVELKESEVTHAQREERTRRIEEGKKAVEKQVPGFEAKANEVIDFVHKDFGIPKEAAELWALNPSGAIMAYESMLYRKMKDKAKKKTRPAVPESKPAKPFKAKSAKTAKSPGKMSPDEYRQWWVKKQQKKRAG